MITVVMVIVVVMVILIDTQNKMVYERSLATAPPMQLQDTPHQDMLLQDMGLQDTKTLQWTEPTRRT